MKQLAVYVLKLLAALVFVVLPMNAQTVTSTVSVIDSNPSTNGSDNLSKVIDYFTSTTVPSAILGQGQYPSGPGGLYLYTTSNPVTGPWTKTTIAASGNFYERAKAFKYPGDTYPGVIASDNGQLIWFANPKNWGGDPTQPWSSTITINPSAGCHDFHLADIDGDGRVDVVCSATSLQNTNSFIAFQNSYNDWTIVNNVTPAGDGIDVVSINGVTGTHIVACNGSSLYWYENPIAIGGNPRQTTPWKANYIGSCNEGIALATGSFNGSDGVIAASNETGSGAWTPGLVWYEPTSNPYAQWTQHVLDSTYRDAHQISTGILNGVAYFTIGEQEQASSSCNSQGYNDHPSVTGCRVAVFTFNNTTATFDSNIISLQGTQNQATVPYGDGFIMVGANHHVYNGYPDFQAWSVKISAPSSASTSFKGGTYTISDFASPTPWAFDGGFYYWGQLKPLEEYQLASGNNYQQWNFSQQSAGVFQICNVGTQASGIANSCLSDQAGTLSLGYAADGWIVSASGAGFTIKNNRTGNYIGPNPAGQAIVTTSSTPTVWSIKGSAAQSITLTSIQISGSSTIATAGLVQLKATGTYSDQTTKDITGSVSWASSQSSVATVQGGSVTGVGAGTASITASLSGVNATTTITVTNSFKAGTYTISDFASPTPWAFDGGFYYWSQLKPLEEYQLTSGNNYQQWNFSQKPAGVFQICNVGTQASGIANSCLSDQAGTLSLGYAADGWIVSASGAGFTIKNNRTGNYIGPNPAGQAIVATSSTPTVWSIKGSAAQSITLTSIQISGSSTIATAGLVQLKATGTYSDQTTKDITGSVSWASSQSSVATVQGGSVTGVGAGTASITASLSGVNATTTITVTNSNSGIGTSGNVVQIDSSMSMSQIQSKINGSKIGDTINFAAGTYNMPSGSNPNGAALNLAAGRTYTGPSSGAPAHLVGNGGYPLMYFAGTTIAIEYLTFDNGSIFLEDGVTSATINSNTFENIDCGVNAAQTVAIFVAGGLNNSDISYNTFQNIGQTCNSQYQDAKGAGGIQMYGFHNLTITHNTFNTVYEGVAIVISNSAEFDGAGGKILNNTFTGVHRIAIEMLGTTTNPSGLEVAYTNYSNALNPWAYTFGLSLTAGKNMIVHDNVMNGNNNQPGYVPYAIEIGGVNSSAYNNTLEGYWGWGFAIGTNTSISITNNNICGPAMAAAAPGSGSNPVAGNAGGFISWEASAATGTFTGNTTSSALTCPR